jgi:peptidyl-prolyl cis-trans isomerase SurA
MNRKPGWLWLGGLAGLLAVGAAAPQSPSSGARVVEEIVARVNNRIITLSDLRQAREALRQDIARSCQGCTPQQIEERFQQEEKNLLSDLIDNALLIQRGEDLGINVEPQVINQLDNIRQRNNIATMEEFERAVTQATGMAFEDYKEQIRNQILTQTVIRQEVVREVQVTREDVEKYYQEHKNDFIRPEHVILSEIFLSTEGKSAEEVAEIEKKANELLEQVRQGADFAELAKRHSNGSTAQRGGELGSFERNQLSKEIADLVFNLRRGQVTNVIRTQGGFLILRVDERFEAGLQSVDKVEGEITNILYNQRIPDALRRYVERLRAESYIYVKPGYGDPAAMANTIIEEVQPKSEDQTENTGKSKNRKRQPQKPPSPPRNPQ